MIQFLLFSVLDMLLLYTRIIHVHIFLIYTLIESFLTPLDLLI